MKAANSLASLLLVRDNEKPPVELAFAGTGSHWLLGAGRKPKQMAGADQAKPVRIVLFPSHWEAIIGWVSAHPRFAGAFAGVLIGFKKTI